MAALNDLSSPTTAVVSLPGEIDVTNAAKVLASITAALAPGVTVVIADLTATRFCDSAALRHLLLAHRQVARVGARLRLAIPPRGPVGRVVELTGINRYVPVYATLQLAMDDAMPPG